MLPGYQVTMQPGYPLIPTNFGALKEEMERWGFGGGAPRLHPGGHWRDGRGETI